MPDLDPLSIKISEEEYSGMNEAILSIAVLVIVIGPFVLSEKQYCQLKCL
jgi:hypothetical protein